MKNPQFVNAKDLKTLEQYGAALLSSMISIRTLEAFNIEAMKKGLLNEDELETAKTICWELQRLMALYKTQIGHITERTELDEKAVIATLTEMMKEKTPKPRKKSESTISNI